MFQKRFRIYQIAVTLGVLLLMIWGFRAMLFDHAPHVFMAKEEDLSYAWLVPPFSLYVLWRERKSLMASLGRPSWLGLLLSLPCFFVGILGVRGVQVRFEMLAFIGLLVTVPWAVFGWQTAKRMLFPALFLCFCLPLATYLDIITVHLRLFATSTAYLILKGFGADIVQKGTMVLTADGSFGIDVAAPCSGLRSIFALMALTAGYAYFSQRTWLRRFVLFACSIPLAVLGNVMRIISICGVALVASPEFATGFYHDYSGYIVFLVAISCMIGCGALIARIGAKPVAAVAEESAMDDGNLSRSAWVLPAVMMLVAVMALGYQAQTPRPIVMAAPKVALPQIRGTEQMFLEPSEAELNVLPADTIIRKAIYTMDNGLSFSVSAVIGGTSKSSIHRPELCLPAQGFEMREPRTRLVDGRSWHFLTVRSAMRPAMGFAYTFFNQEGYATSSHLARIWRDIVDRTFFNRLDRWVMLTVTSSFDDERALTAFLLELQKKVFLGIEGE